MSDALAKFVNSPHALNVVWDIKSIIPHNTVGGVCVKTLITIAQT